MLPNGLTVVLRRDTSAPVVAIVTHVKAGYFDESDEVSGIAHVLEHMYFKGTPTRRPGDIARETKAAGGYLNAGTIYERTTYYTVLPSSGFDTGLAVQADAYANSLIDGDELAREIEVIVEEERRKRDSPGAVAVEACYELLHDVHRMRRWRIGHPERLRTFTRDDVLRFYRTYYVPSNTVLVVVGDVDADVAMRAVAARYGSLPAGGVVRDQGPAEPERRGFRWRDIARDVGQAHAVFGWRGVNVRHADAPALHVAAGVLGAGRGSRLYQEVRERSLAAGVSAGHYSPGEIGVFEAGAVAPTTTFADAVREVFRQVRALGAQEVPHAELQRVKRLFESRWLRQFESMEGQAMHLARWQAEGDWQLGDAWFARVQSVSAADVRGAASEYLTLDRCALVTLRALDAAPLADSPVQLGEQFAALPANPGAWPGVAPEPVVRALAPAQRSRTECGVAVYASAGGVPVLVRRKHGAPIAHVAVAFADGMRAEGETHAGLTGLLARAALQGTRTHGGAALADALERLGASVGAVVGPDAFGWSLSVPNSRLGAGVALLAEIVQHPALSPDAVERERVVALASLASLRDDMGRQPMYLALGAAFTGHHYARPTVGTEAGLQQCSAERVRRHHESLVLGGHGAIVVVADSDADETASLVQSAFASLSLGVRPPVSRASWPAEPRDVFEHRDRAQTAVVLLLPSPGRESRLRHAAHVLATVASGLGGRFFDALRDRESLAYSVHTSAVARPGAGWLSTYIACAPHKEEAAREGILREMQRLVTEPVTEQELARAKAYLLGSHDIRQQSAAAVVNDIADAWMFGTLEELDSDPRDLAAVTCEDVLAVARTCAASRSTVWGAVTAAPSAAGARSPS